MKGTPFGRYELLRKIAAGGMAEIFLARQWGEGGFFRDVVVKRLFHHLAEHGPALRMFQYEARLLAELGHPNIPQVIDLGFAEGTWYMVMELVDGHSVADVWRAGARQGHIMPLPVAIGTMMQACEALHHAHQRRDKAGRPLRIVHRDVTPHNLMLTRDGVAKLLDFGVAQTAARPQTEAGVAKGTYSYMAPEQVRGRQLDARADVFAAGVILYELTTGTRLFRGNHVQVMTQIAEQDAPPPSSRAPDYPRDLEQIVMGALRRDRKQRIASAADLALRLEEFAVRHKLTVGPRAIAEYVTAVYPAERVNEEDAALVTDPQPELDDPSAEHVVDVVTDELSLADPDPHDEGLLADLDMLGPPPEDVPRPFRMPDDEGLDDEDTEPPPAAEPLPQPLVARAGVLGPLMIDEDETSVPMTSPPLALEGFDESTGERPVVLLEQPKRKVSQRPEGEYVKELERRLEGEGES